LARPTSDKFSNRIINTHDFVHQLFLKYFAGHPGLGRITKKSMGQIKHILDEIGQDQFKKRSTFLFKHWHEIKRAPEGYFFNKTAVPTMAMLCTSSIMEVVAGLIFVLTEDRLNHLKKSDKVLDQAFQISGTKAKRKTQAEYSSIEFILDRFDVEVVEKVFSFVDKNWTSVLNHPRGRIFQSLERPGLGQLLSVKCVQIFFEIMESSVAQEVDEDKRIPNKKDFTI
jgi:hypothetical protein